MTTSAPLLKDTRLAKDRKNARGSRPFSRLPAMLGFLQAIEHNMLDVDAPDHTRLRGLVHLAFGQGIHYCLGAPLARLEGQIALRRLLDRVPPFALPSPKPASAGARASTCEVSKRCR